MNDNEKRELNELRRENQILQSKYQRMQSEILDSQMNLEALIKHKKGKWLGFFIYAVLTSVIGIVLYSYSQVQNDSLPERFSSNPLHVINFSLSTTILTFAGVLELFLVIFTIRAGLITIAELGTSSFAKRLAYSKGTINYPQAIQDSQQTLTMQYGELKEIKQDIESIKSRLDELEFLETPWYEQ